MKSLKWISSSLVTTLLGIPGIALAQFGPTVPFAGTSNSALPVALIAIVNVFLILAAIVAAIFLVLGGVQYITSRGDEDQAETAKRTILFAVIGLIVIGLSAAVVNFTVGAINAA